MAFSLLQEVDKLIITIGPEKHSIPLDRSGQQSKAPDLSLLIIIPVKSPVLLSIWQFRSWFHVSLILIEAIVHQPYFRAERQQTMSAIESRTPYITEASPLIFSICLPPRTPFVAMKFIPLQ